MFILSPIADRVVIRAAQAEDKTSSGIYIPQTATEKPTRGEVMAVGPGGPQWEMTLKPGDKVLYGKYSGTDYEHEGQKYLIMREPDVMAIIND